MLEGEGGCGSARCLHASTAGEARPCQDTAEHDIGTVAATGAMGGRDASMQVASTPEEARPCQETARHDSDTAEGDWGHGRARSLPASCIHP